MIYKTLAFSAPNLNNRGITILPINTPIIQNITKMINLLMITSFFVIGSNHRVTSQFAHIIKRKCCNYHHST